MKLNISNRPRKEASNQNKNSGENVKDKPWYRLFKDYGFPDRRIPTDEPPRSKSYGAFSDWVTGEGWIGDSDEDLVLDLLLKRVDPYDYTPAPVEPVANKPNNVNPGSSGGNGSKTSTKAKKLSVKKDSSKGLIQKKKKPSTGPSF